MIGDPLAPRNGSRTCGARGASRPSQSRDYHHVLLLQTWKHLR